MTRLLPVVDESGDEVDARLVCHHEAFLKTASHAQAVCAELVKAWTCLLVEAYVYLVERLHVVYVHTHHVSESVRQEHGVCASCHSLIHVALHQSEFLQALRHKAAYCEVNVHVFHAGTSYVQYVVVTFLHDGVNLELTLCELSVNRERTCVVRAVVVDGLATAVAEHQSSAFQFCHRGIAVHNLAVLAEDGREAWHCSV